MRPADKLCKIPSWGGGVNKKAHDILEKLIRAPELDKYRREWSEKRTHFSITDASIFFIRVMLQQTQLAGRAQDAGQHFVEEYFPKDTIWEDIAAKHLNSLISICQTGFDGKSYASVYNYNEFPRWLKKNAKKMALVALFVDFLFHSSLEPLHRRV